MKYTTGIYKIENLINNKVYIGQSTNIGRRWTIHKYHSVDSRYSDYNYPLYRAFRKYGIENFSFEVIEECEKEKLNEREIYWIEEYDSVKSGYNQVAGGSQYPANRKLTDFQVEEIYQKLKNTSQSQEEIAIQYNVSRHVISDINQGDTYTNPNWTYPIRQREKQEELDICPDCGGKKSKMAIRCMKCAAEIKKTEKPISRENLKNRIRIDSFVQIGKDYCVSDNTIRKWCKQYELPSTKKEIKSYSNEQWELL